MTAAYCAFCVLVGWYARSLYVTWYRNRMMRRESEQLLAEHEAKQKGWPL